MKALLIVAGLTLPLLLTACQGLGKSQAEDEVAVLGSWMAGSFSSEAQSVAQPDDYFDIRLFMVPIWTDRNDGPWLYVEQAAASSLERPYRQRVYHLSLAKSDPSMPEPMLCSAVYELPGDALDFAGAWRTPERFDDLQPSELSEREGCSIFMSRSAGAFAGHTIDAECKSSLRGAAYATSEVTVTPEVLTSWDRGYDADGEQVWGATAGPYVFVKTDELQLADG